MSFDSISKINHFLPSILYSKAGIRRYHRKRDCNNTDDFSSVYLLNYIPNALFKIYSLKCNNERFIVLFWLFRMKPWGRNK